MKIQIKKAKPRMTNTDRAKWIERDEDLYGKWKASGLSMWGFIEANRKAIDTVIKGVRRTPPTARPWIRKSRWHCTQGCFT